jgi:hypothetical protein
MELYGNALIDCYQQDMEIIQLTRPGYGSRRPQCVTYSALWTLF